MKALKWIGIILLILVVIIGISGFAISSKANGILSQTFQIEGETLVPATDSASLAIGEHYAKILCVTCHSADLGGKWMFDDPVFGKVYSPNLTPGKGGVGQTYQVEDWVRTLRHGVNPEGRGLFIMPAKEYQNLSQDHLEGLIGYLMTLPPVDRETPEKTVQLRFPGKMLLATGQVGDPISAEVVDHSAPIPASAPEPAVDTEYGYYTAEISGCTTCHGKQYQGGQDPDPNAPFAPNLSPKGNLGHWTEDHFVRAMRTGQTPEGKTLDDQFMPWPAYANFNDTELKALFAYFKSIPPVESAK